MCGSVSRGSSLNQDQRAQVAVLCVSTGSSALRGNGTTLCLRVVVLPMTVPPSPAVTGVGCESPYTVVIATRVVIVSMYHPLGKNLTPQ
jgi:hypothetical protein